MNKHPLAFWGLSTTEMLQQLQAAKEGLTGAEAVERLARYGFNLLKPPKRSDVFTLLLKDIGFDQVSFFILTPLPGSEDHIRQHVAGVPMEGDLNNYDSFKPVIDHPAPKRRCNRPSRA
jgi:Cation transporter/ATPase, N-terminus